jgi:hypothetical protein
MYILYRLFEKFCSCFSKKINDNEIELLEPLSNLDIEYNLLENNDLIAKFLNYTFSFDIDIKNLICSTINVISSSIVNKNIQLTILSRQNNNKNFFNIKGNNNYKLFELNCIRGDIIEFNFKIDKKIILYVVYNNKNDDTFTEKYEISNQKVSLITYENCNNIKLFLKFDDTDFFYQDLISQTNIWFREFEITNDVNIEIDNIIDKRNNSILIGSIKLSPNLLIYNN